MCRFNKYIFVLVLCIALYTDSAICAPKRHLSRDYSDDDYSYSDDEFDLNYDQRQNGTENIRIVIDGVVIAIPGQETSGNNDAISILGGLLDEILSSPNYDEDDLLTGEHLSNETTEDLSASGYLPNDKDKLPLYNFEQIDKDNNSSNEKINKTMKVPSSFESTISGSLSEEQSTSMASPLTSVNSKERSKHSNIPFGQKKQYSGPRPRNKFRLASLLNTFLKRRSD